MYKAIQEIGGYKIGDEVPAEKAETWLKMYSVAPVEKVGSEEKKSEPEKESSKNVMLDDYLGRNGIVVEKNIKEDNLSKDQLEALLVLEKSDKKRRFVIKALEKKLKRLGK